MGEHDRAKASSETFAEAASFVELNIITTSWTGTDEAIRMANPKNFASKVVTMSPIRWTSLKEYRQDW